VEAQQPLPPLDTTRYQLPAPLSVPGNDDEWKTALDNAHAQLQHQRIRFVVKTPTQAVVVLKSFTF
jgi:hypothetical protein